MDGLYTNRTSRSDFIRDAINNLANGKEYIYIATAFFTEAGIIEDFLKKSCHIRLIVRLGYPTSPHALSKIVGRDSIEVRFYSDQSFHPKLYIFGNKEALVGSANLTGAAVTTNQEIMLSITSEDDRFIELINLFSSYWEEARVLTEEILKKYQALYTKYNKIYFDIDSLQSSIKQDIGNVIYHNIGWEIKKPSKNDQFITDYEKIYQVSLTAFNKIRTLYEKFGRRKVQESQIPLRLEIDSFISFVRQIHATGDSWEKTEKGWGQKQISLVNSCIDEWFTTPWPYFEETIVKINYPKLIKAFSSVQSIKSSSDDDLFDALCTVHSFYEQLRFSKGGLPRLKEDFFSENDASKIRESLVYLLFGNDASLIIRMAKLLFDRSYKLRIFGQSNVQELVGWHNKEDYPVINGRTTKILRYFGFDVKQVS